MRTLSLHKAATGLEQLVSDKMPHVIVRQLQSVDVTRDHAQRADPFVLDVRQLDIKVGPAVQARQRIVLGELSENTLSAWEAVMLVCKPTMRVARPFASRCVT